MSKRKLSLFEKKSKHSELGATLRDALEQRLQGVLENTYARSSAWLLKGGTYGFVGARLSEDVPSRAESLGVADVKLHLFLQLPWVVEKYSQLPFVDESIPVIGNFGTHTGVVKSLAPLEVSDERSRDVAAETCVRHLLASQDALADCDFSSASDVLKLLRESELLIARDYQMAAEVLLEVESGQKDRARAILQAEVKLRAARLGQGIQMSVTPAAKALGAIPATPSPARTDRMLELYRRWLEEFEAS